MTASITSMVPSVSRAQSSLRVTGPTLFLAACDQIQDLQAGINVPSSIHAEVEELYKSLG